MKMDQTFETASTPQFNAFFIRVAIAMVSLHNNRTLTKTSAHITKLGMDMSVLITLGMGRQTGGLGTARS